MDHWDDSLLIRMFLGTVALLQRLHGKLLSVVWGDEMKVALLQRLFGELLGVVRGEELVVALPQLLCLFHKRPLHVLEVARYILA